MKKNPPLSNFDLNGDTATMLGGTGSAYLATDKPTAPLFPKIRPAALAGIMGLDGILIVRRHKKTPANPAPGPGQPQSIPLQGECADDEASPMVLKFHLAGEKKSP